MLLFIVMLLLCYIAQSSSLRQYHSQSLPNRVLASSVKGIRGHGGLHMARKGEVTAESEADGKKVVQARLLVSGGSVQGPYYRTIVKHEAEFHRKLKGTLTERELDKTEILVEGPKARVMSFANWIKKGPQLAMKDRVTLESIEVLETNLISLKVEGFVLAHLLQQN